jgi:hypothetical protein
MRHLLSHRSHAKSIPVSSGFFSCLRDLSKTPSFEFSQLPLTIL